MAVVTFALAGLWLFAAGYVTGVAVWHRRTARREIRRWENLARHYRDRTR